MLAIYVVVVLIVIIALVGWKTTRLIDIISPSMRRELDPASDANTVAVFPLTWSSASGEFTLQFTMGANNATITAVPDTGSQFLIIGGKNCQTCDVSQGVYDESGIDTGTTDTETYGSQTDDISWFIDDMIVPDLTEPLNVEFGTITHASGSSNLNVFGLIGSVSTTDKTPFINQVMYSQQIIAPSFVFDMSTQTTAKLTLGATSAGVVGNAVALLTQAEVTAMVGNDLGIPFYMMRVKGILVDGNAVESPSVCMLDSGSTDLVCSTTLGDSLKTFKSLEIQFDNFSLTYGPEIAGSISPEPDFDNASTYNKQVVILGNRFWIGHILSFDLQKKQITISDPDPADT